MKEIFPILPFYFLEIDGKKRTNMSIIGLDWGSHHASIAIYNTEKDSLEVIADDMGKKLHLSFCLFVLIIVIIIVFVVVVVVVVVIIIIAFITIMTVMKLITSLCVIS